MVHILEKVLGVRIRYVNVPPFLAAMWMRCFGLPQYVVDGLIETLGALQRNEYAYATDSVERVTCSKPRSFEAWCRENIPAFQ
jgi:hypothetical protein